MAERVRRQPRAQTRTALLDAAAQEFARRGFHGASVEGVAAAAGFSTGAVYSNFAGKEDLFLALYEERIQRRRAELRAAFAASADPEAGLASTTADAAAAVAREREWFLLFFEFTLHAARDPEFAARFRAVREEGLSELADGLAQGLAQAGVDPSIEVDELARAVRALSYGLALDEVAGDPTQSGVLGRVIELIVRGMAAEAPRDPQG